jgi:hypothetical protein
VTPKLTSNAPATTVPATFAGAEMSRTSSIRPTRNITEAATSTPSGSELRANNGSNPSSNRDTANATTKPMNSAMPPTSGNGTVCTVRSLGSYTQPMRVANHLTSGVATNVTTAATAPMSR